MEYDIEFSLHKAIRKEKMQGRLGKGEEWERGKFGAVLP